MDDEVENPTVEGESTNRTNMKFIISNMSVWAPELDFSAAFSGHEKQVANYAQKINNLGQRLDGIDFLSKPRKVLQTPSTSVRNIIKPDETELSHTNSLELLKKPIKVGDKVYFQHIFNKPWKLGSVRNISIKCQNIKIIVRLNVQEDQEDLTRIIFNCFKWQIARNQRHGRFLRAGKRVIAGRSLEEMFSGIIANEPMKENKFRYLVFFDNGDCQYIQPDKYIFPILAQSEVPWRDASKLSPLYDEVLQSYLEYFFKIFPQRVHQKIAVDNKVLVTKNGVFVDAIVINRDCDIATLRHEDETVENIYVGSPRFIQKADNLAKMIKKNPQLLDLLNASLFEDISRYHLAGKDALNELPFLPGGEFSNMPQQYLTRDETRVQVAKKSTSSGKCYKIFDLENRFGNEYMKDATLLTEDEIKACNHTCELQCLEIEDVQTESSVQDIVEEFRDVSDLMVPLLLGWRRFFCKTKMKKGQEKFQICYEAPCKVKFLSAGKLPKYFQRVNSKLDIDYFTFETDIKLNRLREQLTSFKAMYYIENVAVDESNRPIERKSISLLNEHDEEALPLDFKYRSTTEPIKNLSATGVTVCNDFKSGCDCDDDCYRRSECDCHDITSDASGPPRKSGELIKQCQYINKRLIKSVRTGIFECNTFCKCSSKCPNRVVQNGIRFRLQLKKTKKKGWSVITLDDIPKGAFICTYSADLLDDADAYGQSDTYYADLDFVSINEQRKEGEDNEKSDEGIDSDSQDDQVSNISKKVKTSNEHNERNNRIDSDSDSDERVESRYPKRDLIKCNREKQNKTPKYKRIHDILNSHDFTLDAKQSGNIGRFLNHSCDPNSTSQNVFIDTHDLRLPTVAFFALRNIMALDEITWNYNYKCGSIPGRKIFCHCGSANCSGRIL